MSFMTAVGLMYHCSKCGAVLTVPFPDGPRLIQIGDFGCMAQAELNEKHRCGEPWIHEEDTLCEDCARAEFPDSVFANSAVVSALEDVNGDAEIARRRAKEAVAERAEAFLQRHTESYDVPAMEADSIREILKDRNIGDAGRRKRLVKRNVSERREAILDALVAAMQANVDTAGILAAFENERRRLKAKFEELFGRIDRSVTTYLRPCATTGMMNFNPYICYEGSVAELDGAKPGGKAFFTPYGLDAGRMAFNDRGMACWRIFRDLAERSDFCRMLQAGMLKALERAVEGR